MVVSSPSREHSRPSGVPTRFKHAGDRTKFKRRAHRGGIELCRAHIVRHAVELHTHEAIGLAERLGLLQA
jgi:hypothetical protein